MDSRGTCLNPPSNPGIQCRSAFQAFDDDAGSLEVGACADVVVLDRDITAIAGTEVADVLVDETWLNGTRVFHR